jgi:hypothetical protein
VAQGKPGAGGVSFELAVLAVVAAALAVIFVAHVRAYFFLLDDFVILGEVTSRPVRVLLGQPLFNFYRPAEHLWVKALFVLFGWTRPGGYVAMSLALHAVCSLLTALFARLCARDARTGLIAGTLFLISPWASEPYFWMSGGFDLIATAGLLTALTLGLAGLDARTPGAAAASFAGGAVAATVAMLAKEIGVLAPVVFAATVVLTRGPRALLKPRGMLFTLVLSLVAGGYLLLRESLLPGLGGGYGSLGTLVERGSLARGAFSYARALIALPLPSSPEIGPLSPAVLLSSVFAVAVAVAAWQALRTAPRLAALSIVSIALSVAPVLWVSLIQGSSAGNRFLYFAGAWYSLLLAVGIARLGGVARATALVLIAGIGIGSVDHQARIWRTASRLSRASIDQLRPYQGTTRPLFIGNLPANFTDGPYVINALAFRYYFRGVLPPVGARAMTLKYDRGEAVLAFWMDDTKPAPGADVVTLSLPVWVKDPRMVAAIETPGAGAAVPQPFAVRGWAIDTNARGGTGVDSVRVYGYPVPGGEFDAVFVGQARYGDSRPDVARQYGSRFERCGFTLEATGLHPGRYRIAAFARSATTRTSAVAWTGEIVVR